MLPMMAGLLLVGLTVLSLCHEVVSLHGTYVVTSAAADAAAEAGAAMLDEDAVYRNELLLDVEAATAVAVSVVEASGVEVRSIDVTTETICVDAASTHSATALAFVGLGSVDVVVRACAQPAAG